MSARTSTSAFQIYHKLLWIVLAAFVMRVAARLYFGSEDFWTNGYSFFFDLARSIAAGKGIAFAEESSTSFRVPIYPAFLAMVTFGHKVFLPIVLSQSLIGAGTVLCAALLAREMFGNAAAIIAATITAFYPYYVVHDTAMQETSLYTFLTALAIFLLLRAHRSGSGMMAGGAGLTLGMAVLTRANLAPFALFAPLWLAIPAQCPTVPRRQRLWTAVVCLAVLALTVSPWLVRSFRLGGSVTLSTETGYFLWLGNNPYTFSYYPHESIDRSQRAALEALSPQDRAEIRALGSSGGEAAVDQRFYGRRALEYIREHPWWTVGGGLRKIGAAFDWLPSPRKDFWRNAVHALTFGPVMALGLWGMWAGRRNWREHLIFYALFVSFAAVTAVFFGHTNYRTYLDVYWIVFAAGISGSGRSGLAQQTTAGWFGRGTNAQICSNRSSAKVSFGSLPVSTVDLVINPNRLIFGRQVEAIGKAVHVGKIAGLEHHVEGPVVPEFLLQRSVVCIRDRAGSTGQLARKDYSCQLLRCERGIILLHAQQFGRVDAEPVQTQHLMQRAVAASVGQRNRKRNL
jgi:4-amino-4-deoxy-L-arabinose transferase-like glycosyltransferase